MEEEYLGYYHIEGYADFRGGEFPSGAYSIWSWCLEPEKWEETVVLLHGFLDHSLSNRLLVNELLKRGFRVVAGDMPGHGRSSGIRGGILSFREYADFFDGLLRRWDVRPERSYAVGHSTGCSILMDYNRRGSDNFKGVVMAAPLVKMNYQLLIDKGIDLAQDWIKVLPVRKTKSSGNKPFLKFKWKDPLGVKRFSLDWIKAMVEWNREWEDFSSNQPLLLLQGDRDNVVEWKSNTPVLERCYSRCRTVHYKKGRHHILNESERIRREVYRDLFAFLS